MCSVGTKDVHKIRSPLAQKMYIDTFVRYVAAARQTKEQKTNLVSRISKSSTMFLWKPNMFSRCMQDTSQFNTLQCLASYQPTKKSILSTNQKKAFYQPTKKKHFINREISSAFSLPLLSPSVFGATRTRSRSYRTRFLYASRISDRSRRSRT
jgi:hypothetical protein